jgi:hypothetical protein
MRTCDWHLNTLWSRAACNVPQVGNLVDLGHRQILVLTHTKDVVVKMAEVLGLGELSDKQRDIFEEIERRKQKQGSEGDGDDDEEDEEEDYEDEAGLDGGADGNPHAEADSNAARKALVRKLNLELEDMRTEGDTLTQVLTVRVLDCLNVCCMCVCAWFTTGGV